MTEPVPSLRALFLIDGFNLYHSMEALLKEYPDKKIKWLDLNALARKIHHLVAPNISDSRVVYFTTLATHLHLSNPGKIARHNAYIRALTASRIEVVQGRFQPKDVWAAELQHYVQVHEEKETDVAIASRLLQAGFCDEADVVVVVTADTDLKPAVETFKKLNPGKQVLFAFPWKRKNQILAQLASSSFSLGPEHYESSQFPPAVRLPSGKFVYKPKEW